MSELSTLINDEISNVPDQSAVSQEIHTHLKATSRLSRNEVLAFVVSYRLLNALVLQTFFQPDEYFQSLEPAWHLAFGDNSGAWITWEWKHHLRAAVHPAIFSICYQLANALSHVLSLNDNLHAEVLLVSPKLLQAAIAALGDFYTWRLAEEVYGLGSRDAITTLILTIISPWQWFCSTRIFSNTLECTLTTIALYCWPWHSLLFSDGKSDSRLDSDRLKNRHTDSSQAERVDEVTTLRRALLCASFATILRPTNILIWLALVFCTAFNTTAPRERTSNSRTENSAQSVSEARSFLPTLAESAAFLRESALCGGISLATSAIVDRMFYKTWVFPMYNFFRFNVLQSIAVFYGNNNWHYYLSQGYPLLLTTTLPFAVIALYRTLSLPNYQFHISPLRKILRSLAVVCVFVPTVLSVISHKEVRFIYPILPALHILAAQPFSSFFAPAFQRSASMPTERLPRRVLLSLLLALNILVAFYTTVYHNSGLVNITHYLRHQYEEHYLTSTQASSSTILAATNMTVGFFMPCHSTPWRSHLQYPPTANTPGIDAWALTCEPPLDLTLEQKRIYLDEADQFYANPSMWVKRSMSRNPPPNLYAKPLPGVYADAGSQGIKQRRIFESDPSLEKRDSSSWRERKGRRPWPEYLVFFEQLEPELKHTLRGSAYVECERIWNSHFHEDSRRQGDVVVWCLYPDRAEVRNIHKRDDQRNWLSYLLSGFKRRSGLSMRDVEDALHDPNSIGRENTGDSGGVGGQRILAAGNANPRSKKEKVKKTKSASAMPDRVVEKPFWKTRLSRQQAAEKETSGLSSWLGNLLGRLSDRKRSEKQKKSRWRFWNNYNDHGVGGRGIWD